MRSMIKVRLAFVIGAVALVLAGTPAFAVWSTNSWTTDGSGYSGDYTNAAHFSPGLPVTTDQVWFTNAQSSAYTVTFQENVTNGILRVGTDKVIFDLNGKFWRLEEDPTGPSDWFSGGNRDADQQIAMGAGENATVTFTSSSPGSNTVYMYKGTGWAWFGNDTGSTTINIMTNGTGNSIRLWGLNGTDWGMTVKNATINISGPGAEWNTGAGGGGWNNSILNVTDGGKFIWSAGDASYLFARGDVGGGTGNTVNVSNGGIVDTSAAAGKDNLLCWVFGQDKWNITAGGTWIANGIEVGERNYGGHPDPYDGAILVDGAGSSLTATRIDIGAGGDPGGGPANGSVVVQNGAILTVASNILVGAQVLASPNTNRLVLGNATIRLGGAVGGTLTNRGIMRAMGTITGLGSSPALVRNEKLLEVGGSIGTLTLSNANLELAAGSQTLWEFSSTGLDQINVVGGWAKLDGTNLFSIVGSTNGLVPGVKWGLGVYDFVLGTGVTAGVNFYANMTNLLSSAPYSLVYGVDYRFGVVDLGGGLQALELAFVPEPSTVLLLVGGGLVLWRVRRRNG